MDGWALPLHGADSWFVCPLSRTMSAECDLPASKRFPRANGANLRSIAPVSFCVSFALAIGNTKAPGMQG